MSNTTKKLGDCMYRLALAALRKDKDLSVRHAAIEYSVDPAVLVHMLTARELRNRPIR